MNDSQLTDTEIATLARHGYELHGRNSEGTVYFMQGKTEIGRSRAAWRELIDHLDTQDAGYMCHNRSCDERAVRSLDVMGDKYHYCEAHYTALTEGAETFNPDDMKRDNDAPPTLSRHIAESLRNIQFCKTRWFEMNPNAQHVDIRSHEMWIALCAIEDALNSASAITSALKQSHEAVNGVLGTLHKLLTTGRWTFNEALDAPAFYFPFLTERERKELDDAIERI